MTGAAMFEYEPGVFSGGPWSGLEMQVAVSMFTGPWLHIMVPSVQPVILGSYPGPDTELCRSAVGRYRLTSVRPNVDDQGRYIYEWQGWT